MNTKRIALVFALCLTFLGTAKASIQYAGGTNVSATITSDGTQQTLISGIEDNLNTAGWTTDSGHHTATIVLTSATTPTANNHITIRLKTTGSNCATLEIANSTLTQISSTLFMLPGASGVTWRIIADRYQFAAFVPGSTATRQFIFVTCPYIPTFLQGVITADFGWANGNGGGDTDTVGASSLRADVTATGANNNRQAWCGLINSNLQCRISSAGFGGGAAAAADWQLFLPMASRTGNQNQWHDNSYQIGEPLIGWGLALSSDPALIRGQLWDAMWISQFNAVDSTLSSVDTHNWWAVGSNNNVNSEPIGTLFLVTP